MKGTWEWELDFDAQGDPPRVHLYLANGPSIILDEDPVLKNGGDPEDEDAWSWEEEDWLLGPMAATLLSVLNTSTVDWPIE